jgi:hypothetical protein
LKIVLTTQPTLPTPLPGKYLLAAKQSPQNFQQAAKPLQQPYMTASQAGQIERVITLFHQPNQIDRVFLNPVSEYQMVESLEKRLVLETLVGVDIYV